MANQRDGVTLGYSRSNGQYHVEEIRGSRPTATYQRIVPPQSGVPSMERYPETSQLSTITIHVGDWLSEGAAFALGVRTHVTVRPYRLTHERPAEEGRGKRTS